MEIACDESGSEGEHLIGGETDVFAHASVLLSTEAAAGCVQELRDRIRSPAEEYKANHLLRRKHRSALIWLLGTSGPIHGNAFVHLTDKELFVVGKIVGLLGAEATDREILYREGPSVFGRDRWTAFLVSFNDLMRTKNRSGRGTSVDSFFGMVDALRVPGTPGRVHEIMDLLRGARPRVEAMRQHVHLDPLIPALAATVARWSAHGPVAIVHDVQTALTAERIARLTESGRLISLRLVDSRSDPRVQVADFLAGTARKIASNELNGAGDAELSALLSPYVDSRSTWLAEASQDA